MWQSLRLKTHQASNPTQRLLLYLMVIASFGLLGVSIYTLTNNLTRPQEHSSVPNEPSFPELKTVTALGRLEPKGEIIKVSAPSTTEGNRVDQLLVKEGDKVTDGQVIAILSSKSTISGSLKEAQKKVEVAQAQLAQVKAGVKEGEITAGKAIVNRLQAELKGYVKTQEAEIARLKTQLTGDSATLQATVNRLESEQLLGKRSLQATVARTAAEKRNATAEVQRYETLYQQGAISKQEVDKRRLTAETAAQQLLENEANQAKITASLQQQIAEAKAKQYTTLASLEKQIQEAEANRDKTIAILQQQIEEAKGNLASSTEVRITDVAKMEADVDTAKAGVERIQKQLDQAYIRAPKAGTVLSINTLPGENISNQGIVELGQTDQMYAVVEIYQSDIGKVQTGQNVMVSNNSLGTQLKGSIDRVGWKVKRQNIINSDPASNLDSRVVEVYVRLDEASSKQAEKLTNMQVKAVIEI
jgi:HlyD family secretion protein